MIKIVNYITNTNKEPFQEWLDKIDITTRAIIRARLARIRLGNFGDCKQLKRVAGIWELRISYGAGYRVYFGKRDSSFVVLLSGGDKGSQKRDIEKVKQYWLDYKG